MIFTIDPPSGHSHSALDIHFKVEVDHADQMQIEIFNATINEQLEILSVSTGYIKNGKTVSATNTNVVEGHINLFNKDKMNESLNDYPNIDLQCVNIIKTEDTTVQEEVMVTFFNESQSLDAEIIPFDLVLDNHEIDLKHNLPLQMHVVCDSEQRFELSIRSEDHKNSCTFEIFTKKGRTDVIVPSEMIWSDLELTKKHLKKFHIYWVKFEGVNHMNLMNRKYILINDTRLTFNCTTMMPRPQSRLGPTGIPLPKDFVLSHRYFVHTWRGYTALGRMPFMYSDKKMYHMTAFMHEIQHTEIKKSGGVKAFGVDEAENESEVRKAVKDTIVRKHYKLMDPRQKVVVEAFAKPYITKSVLPATDRHYVRSFSVPTSKRSLPSKKGCGCSRKPSY